MATLEKIRSKGALLIIVIGVALLAFIVGDALTSGRTLFGNPTMIAKVGNHKIDVTEFQQRYEQVNQQLQQQGSKQDPAVVQKYVLDQMIQEQLIEDEIEALGIAVTDAELTNAMIGENALPMMVQFAQQYGFESPEQMLDMVNNPAKYQLPEEQANQLRAIWNEQENNVEQGLKQMKFSNLLAGALVANNLDAKAIYDNNASTAHISYVKQAFSTLEDDKYPVSDDEIKAQYAKEKSTFRTDEEVRNFNYIAINIAPSQEDLVAAQQAVETAITALTEKPELEGVAGDVNFGIDRQKNVASQIKNAKVKEFITAANAGDVKLISFIGNEYTVAKALGKKNEVDSININMIAFNGDAAARDSVVTALNSGKAFEEVLKMNGVQGGQADMWASLLSINNNDVKERLINAPANYFIGDSVGTQAMIYRVNEKKAPVEVYDYAVLSYKVDPSEATIDDINTKIDAFLVENNNAAAMTAEKAAEAGYTLLSSSTTPTAAQVANIPSSRAAIKWLMDAEEGQVSPIFEAGQNSDRLLVVALTEVVEPGYLPVSTPSIKQYLTNRVRNDKKAADLIAQYQGKATDLQGFAKLIAPEDTAAVAAATVTFGQPYIPGIGFGESALIGQVSTSPLNTVVGPIQTNNAVIVYQVNNIDNEGRPYNFDESANNYAAQLGSQAVMQKVVDILRKGTEVETDMLKFFSE